MSKSVIKTVLDGDWAALKKNIEVRAAEKIKSRIEEKKVDVLSTLNGVSREQMEELVAIKIDKK